MKSEKLNIAKTKNIMMYSHSILAEQQREYEESLRIDQAKDSAQKTAEEEQERLAQENLDDAPEPELTIQQLRDARLRMFDNMMCGVQGSTTESSGHDHTTASSSHTTNHTTASSSHSPMTTSSSHSPMTTSCDGGEKTKRRRIVIKR